MKVSSCFQSRLDSVFTWPTSTISNYLKKKTNDIELTKDIIQEAFTRLWINKDNFETLKETLKDFTEAKRNRQDAKKKCCTLFFIGIYF